MRVGTSYSVRIYLSGPIEVAKQILRRECQRNPICVTIEPTVFIYPGGEEAGYVVGLINYPKYPKTEQEILGRARELMERLRSETYHDSGLILTPETTEWEGECAAGFRTT